MRKTLVIKKKHCINFEDFAFDLWISDKHSDYWTTCAIRDKKHKIEVGDEDYSCTMVDYQLETFKKWNWEILIKEIKDKWRDK